MTERPEGNLTSGQQLIWLGQKLSPNSPLYNMAMLFELGSGLDIDCLQRAFQDLVDTNDSLRTVFTESNGVPASRVVPNQPYKLPLLKLAETEHKAVHSWAEQRSRNMFDLEACSFDSALLISSDGKLTWYICVHHLCVDVISTTNLLAQFSRLYRQRVTDNSVGMNDIPQFGDYVRYEQDFRNNEAYLTASKYWKSAEKDYAPLSFYGQQCLRPDTASKRITLNLGAERQSALRNIMRSRDFPALNDNIKRINLIATALTAFLYRVCDRESVAIGIPVHNRRTQAFADTVGLFVEIFPLASEISGEESFSELYLKVSERMLNLFRHAQPGTGARELSRQFNVVLNYITATADNFAGEASNPQWIHSGHVDPSHALRVQILDIRGTGNIEIYLDFNCSWFESDRLQEIAGHFLAIFDAMLVNPHHVVREVSLLGDNVEESVTSNSIGADTTSDDPDKTVLHRFAEQVRRSPDEVALVHGARELTFDQLDRMSSILANSMREKYPSAKRIGIHLSRSANLIIAVLATLKTGSAFIPLERSFPRERLEQIVKRSGLSLVLGDNTEPLETDLDTDHLGDAPVLRLGNEILSTNETEITDTAVDPQSHAYVLFTSGSSGEPKGVSVSHASLERYIKWSISLYTRPELELEGRCTFPFYSAFGFDLTLTSIFVPLCSGGCIRVYEEPDAPVDLSIMDVVLDNQVDVIKLTPAHLGAIAESKIGSSRVHTLIVGGENLETTLASKALELFGADTRIINEYGPTEAVVGCMHHAFNPEHDTGPSVPIGVAADNMRIYLLDHGLHQVPRGVAGEIVIASRYLANGYINDPASTSEKFLKDPFEPGSRIYRSGDLARADHNGNLTYLGRMDNQLKIRGVRVEPAEIAAVLDQHPEVRNCFIGVWQNEETPQPEVYCSRCGISSRYPETHFNERGVCQICTDFDNYQEQAHAYFKSLDEFRQLVSTLAMRKTGKHDCLLLFSGGKDSTYALYQISAMGFRVYAMTLDNGYISDGAKGNIQRAVDDLGIDHEFVTTPDMKRIFKDSLNKHASVCYGCFKTIYTLGINLADSLGIPCIVTGLSRGQFFETRLVKQVFENGEFDSLEIDRQVLETRKIYHRLPDQVTASLDMSLFENDEVFDRIEFVDFYRYCDASLDDIYDFLENQAPWLRPEDTGRSTNCLINNTGIYVHKAKLGFHNYALPYSWDVRLGHKKREAAIDELIDHIDHHQVMDILEEIDYRDPELHSVGQAKLVAWYEAESDPGSETLRNFVRRKLPESMVPTWFTPVSSMPLTRNGKIDKSMLPEPHHRRPNLTKKLILPSSEQEILMAKIWRDALRIDRVGIHDNFFDLGGDSIIAIQIVSAADHHGLKVTPNQLFMHQTIASLLPAVSSTNGTSATKDTSTKSFGLIDEDMLEDLASALERG